MVAVVTLPPSKKEYITFSCDKARTPSRFDHLGFTIPAA